MCPCSQNHNHEARQRKSGTHHPTCSVQFVPEPAAQILSNRTPESGALTATRSLGFCGPTSGDPSSKKQAEKSWKKFCQQN